jgi:hypothetical protein
MSAKARELHAKACIADRGWRLRNLYKIKDKHGNVIDFTPNWAQQLLEKPHYLNLILKARQLGVTTFFSILFLDTCLFNDNVHAAIIADNKPTSREIFIDKVKFAYDNLPEWVRAMTPAYRDNINELRFSNGSVFRVGTGLRGGTLQLLHITEFAKICVENPIKASEIMSGALNTLQAGQFCTIESTARGREGFFYEMCQRAISAQESGKELSAMDWKFWFFPWWKEAAYTITDQDVIISPELNRYFLNLEKQGIHLNYGQKAWYIKKLATQGEYMTREFPSTPEESFESAHEGFYYAKLMADARKDRRVCHMAIDPYAAIYAAWDIGMADATAIWTFQCVGNEIHYLDYYENSGEALEHYAKWIKKLPYEVDKHYMPHDSAAREKGSGKAYVDYAREAGLKVEIIKKTNNLLTDIEMGRGMFNRCWFDQSRVVQGMKAIENYKKEWNEQIGCFRERPLHNWASHGTKAWMYSLNAVQMMTSSGRGMSKEEWRNVRNQNV